MAACLGVPPPRRLPQRLHQSAQAAVAAAQAAVAAEVGLQGPLKKPRLTFSQMTRALGDISDDGSPVGDVAMAAPTALPTFGDLRGIVGQAPGNGEPAPLPTFGNLYGVLRRTSSPARRSPAAQARRESSPARLFPAAPPPRRMPKALAARARRRLSINGGQERPTPTPARSLAMRPKDEATGRPILPPPPEQPAPTGPEVFVFGRSPSPRRFRDDSPVSVTGLYPRLSGFKRNRDSMMSDCGIDAMLLKATKTMEAAATRQDALSEASDSTDEEETTVASRVRRQQAFDLGVKAAEDQPFAATAIGLEGDSFACGFRAAQAAAKAAAAMRLRRAAR